MILSDFLSRQKHDSGNPHEIIPILFSMQNVLQTRYCSIGEREQGNFEFRQDHRLNLVV